MVLEGVKSIWNKVYLSLGSNRGDRMAYLQSACDELHERAGILRSVSPVYHTEAWGFRAPAFHNIVVELDTAYSPHELLDIIQQIERVSGRLRSNTHEGYASRNLDIDILYYGWQIIDTEDLKVPHPHMADRKFVLAPLHDIAPELQHPVLKKTTAELLQGTKDEGTAVRIKERIFLQETLHPDYSYIAIEGNIGAGKTSLTHMLAADFNAKTVLERFADNPFLPKFYEDQERYAFPLEMSFLADRYQQLSDDLAQFDLFKNLIISDYYIFKSLIFAGVTLGEDEYMLYRKVFNFMYKEITKPDLYVFLYQDTGRLLENIKKRGREYEQSISPEYLQQIHEAYHQFIKSQEDLNVLIIDVTSMDFVSRPKDYWEIIKTIRNH